jgi:YfiH family protein
VWATHVHDDLVWLRWEAPGAPLLVFTTRRGGVSPPPYDGLNLGRSTDDAPAHVTENRRRLLTALGREPDSLVTAGQVHGRGVKSAFQPGHLATCDALLTTRPGLTLAVTTADCAPVLLCAPGALAAVHAGWRGAAAGVVGAAVAELRSTTGCGPAAIHALLGPCIRRCCYTVGPEVARRFDPRCVLRVDQELRLDLPAAISLELERLGVGELADSGRCTSCEPAWFFSHRRDRGLTGRQWAVAALDPSDVR